MPLNGAAANTEGGKLQREIATRAHYRAPTPVQGNPTSCYSCTTKQYIQPNITPSESSRITILTATMNGTLVNGGCVTQDRARQLLMAAKSPQYGSQGVRIAAIQQATIAASDDSALLKPIILPGCPPLPPPPAPPSRACPLPKNMRLGGM